MVYLIIYFVLCIYSHWRGDYDNKKFKSEFDLGKETEPFLFYLFLFLISPIYIFIIVILNGVKVLNNRGFTLNGEKRVK